MVKRAATAMAAGRFSRREIFHKLEGLQQQLYKIDEQVHEKIMEIENKYNGIKDPVYRKRNEIINSIQDFWLLIFSNHPVLENMMTKYDQEIFEYLDSLSVEDLPYSRKGYRITFAFKVNPYFKNKILTKTIKFTDDGTQSSVGTRIMWKPDEGPLAKSSNMTSIKKKPSHWKSFFNWFSDALVNKERDEVAEIIKEDIWPNPIVHLDNVVDDDDETEDDEGKDGNGEDGGSAGLN